MPREEILVVDDEAAIRTALKHAFRRENINVTEASDGSEALTLLEKQSFDLVILDLMMENVGGYEVLQSMRARNNLTPVMLLSGKSDEMDQVLGYGYGADSYLTKPFHISVLIQNAKALIRRSREYSRERERELIVGEFRIDGMRMECFKGREPLSLTARELKLFRFFMENPGRVFTKEQLYRQVWDEIVVDDNTVTVYIKRLRTKVERDSGNPVYIKTIRGIGYRFDPEG